MSSQSPASNSSNIKTESGGLKANLVVCIECENIFRTQEDFFAHAKSCNPIFKQKRCKRIRRKNPSKHELLTRMFCPFCNKKRKVRTTLMHLYMHVTKFHVAESESDEFKNIVEECASHQTNKKKELVQCEECGINVKNSIQLQIHIGAVHRNESFKCSICERPFRSKRYLNFHSLTHTNATIPCEQCNQVFKKTSCLTRHTKVVHLKIKNMKC